MAEDKEITAPLLELKQIHDALMAIDNGSVKETAKGEMKPQPFDIEGTAMLGLAINLNALRPLVRAYDTAMKRQQLGLADEKGELSAAAQLTLHDAGEKLLAEPASVRLTLIKRAGLKFEHNKALGFRALWLAWLTPVLEE